MKNAASMSALLVAGATLISPAAQALTKAEKAAFEKAGFVTCDAKLIALNLDTTDIKEAISIAGQKVINDDLDTVKEMIADGRKQNNGNLMLCPPEDTYSAADIALFADFWDLGKKAARDTMSEKLLDGNKEAIDWAIAEQKKNDG